MTMITPIQERAEQNATVDVMVRFESLREQVRGILLANHVSINHMADIEDVYRVLDYCWLRSQGLPWLDRDVYNKLHALIHQLSSVERLARFIWRDAENGREGPELRLPPALKRQRRRKAKAHAQVFAKQAGRQP